MDRQTDNMNNPAILVVSRCESRMQAYRNILEQMGMRCIGLADLKAVPVLVSATPVNGIAIDMPVQIKASSRAKIMVEDILSALPSVYINIMPSNNNIKVLTATGTQGIFHNLEQFVAVCFNFRGRVVRPKNRIELNLNAIISHPADEYLDLERSVTINASTGGCFLFTARAVYKTGQLININFISMKDNNPITASVRWLQPWGVANLVPGIGVRFEQITKEQLEELGHLIRALEPA